MNSSEQTSALIKSLIDAQKKICAAKISMQENSFETLKNSERDALINEIKSILQTESVFIEHAPKQSVDGYISFTTRLFHHPSKEWIEAIFSWPRKFADSEISDNMAYFRNLSIASMLYI